MSENERRILIGSLTLKHFFYLHKDDTLEKELQTERETLSLRHFVERAQESFKRVDDPKKSEPRKIDTFSQVHHNSLFFLQDLKIEDDKAIFLFDFINPQGANTAIKNQKNHSMRVVHKAKDEGIDYSAHFIVDLNGNNGVYSAALEDVTGLPPSIINRLLSRLNMCVQKYHSSAYWIPHPSLPDEKRKVRSQLTFGVSINQDFWDAIKHKENLCELVLLSRESETFDQCGIWKTKKQHVYLSLPDDNFYSDAVNALRRLCQMAKAKNFRYLMVRLKDALKKPRMVTIDTETMEEKTRSYVKSETVSFDKTLATGYDRIDDDVVKAIIRVMQ